MAVAKAAGLASVWHDELLLAQVLPTPRPRLLCDALFLHELQLVA